LEEGSREGVFVARASEVTVDEVGRNDDAFHVGSSFIVRVEAMMEETVTVPEVLFSSEAVVIEEVLLDPALDDCVVEIELVVRLESSLEDTGPGGLRIS
jgi:hypothetical protein